MQITAQAPTRIDLAGGTLDIWPLYLMEEDSVTVNVAVNLYARATLQELANGKIEIVSQDQNTTESYESMDALDVTGRLSLISRLVRHFAPRSGLRLETDCTAPAGSGLGGSSSLAIAVSGALNEFTGRGYTREDLIAVCRDIEAQVLGIPTGEQDYYAATYGGCNGWHFGVRETKRIAYTLSPAEVCDRILLFYSGQARSSGINNWHVFRSYLDGEEHVKQALSDIRREAFRAHRSLEEEDWGEVYEAVQAEWEARKRLAPSITTPEIDDLIEFGITNGSRLGRVCGAGGGGCVVFMIDTFTRSYLYDLAKEKGHQILDFEVDTEGLAVTKE